MQKNLLCYGNGLTNPFISGVFFPFFAKFFSHFSKWSALKILWNFEKSAKMTYLCPVQKLTDELKRQVNSAIYNTMFDFHDFGLT